MKKKFILCFIFVIILLCIFYKINIKQNLKEEANEKIRKNYEDYSLKENLIFNMKISNGDYEFIKVDDFSIKSIETKNKEQFHINDENLKYYGFAISKDENEYIYTSINNDNIDILKHNIPLKKEDCIFIKNNFLISKSSNDIAYINIFPFKNQDCFFIEKHYNNLHITTYSILNLKDKTIKGFQDIYRSPFMNLKQNVVVMINKAEFSETNCFVFDKEGRFIEKY